jgi:acyl carrier protein
MNTKQELLARLQQISSEQLGVREQKITEDSTWAALGADSLDRLAMSRAVEDAFSVEIPHQVGEQLNTVGETLDHLLNLIALRGEISSIRIEAASTNQQWAEILGIRTQVFTMEYGFSVKPLPGPVDKRVWHFLARDNNDPVGTLSVVDTTGDRQLHKTYRLQFPESERVARYAQCAILKGYRQQGIFKKLIDAAERAIIRPNGFTSGWLLYPAAQARSSVLTRSLGFTAEAPLLTTEFGHCHALVRRESDVLKMSGIEESYPVCAICPI